MQTRRPSSSDAGNVHTVRDLVNSVMPFHPTFAQGCTGTWWPLSSEFGGHVHLQLEQYLKTANVDAVKVEVINPEAVGVGASIQEPFDPDAGDRVEVAMES